MAVKQSKITKGVIHKSASDVLSHANIKTIDGWHKDRGFLCILDNGSRIHIGYHFLIDKAGNVFRGRPIEYRGAHCYGHNVGSIGICLAGDKHFTEEQRKSLNLLQDEIEEVYGKLDWYGHCELDHRPEKADCPHVDKSWYK